MPNQAVEAFISRWSVAGPSERANAQIFLAELCDVLAVPRPDPQRDSGYAFEFPVTEYDREGKPTEGRIDLYKRACLVLEAKQFQDAKPEPTQLELAAEAIGAIPSRRKSAAPVRDTERWDDAMLKALVQAERYTRALPKGEPNPPFLLVVDVGHVIEVRADFTQAGRAYLPFPDPRTHRIRLTDLRREELRERLRLVWTNPQSLDPSRRSTEVTREVSGYLAELAKSFEGQGHAPKTVAEFLTRCLFCMFAEDVGLLPDRQTRGFTELLESLPANGEGFVPMLRTLFREMNEGRKDEVSVILRRKLLRFNGGLFASDTVLPVNGTQLGLIKAAAKLDWHNVEPSIFGTLLERALGGEGERRKLGAHFTPRAYVERLVLPTVVEPLRAEWEDVRAAAVAHGSRGEIKEARDEINRFHHYLCELKVLDPACGSGNFLYVALEHLKRLEGEVLDLASQFGESFKLDLETHTVDPHQFLGLEINPRAAAIAELVLWIGYLQWHFRTRGQMTPDEPVLKKFNNIQCRDAVLAYDGEPQPTRDETGKATTAWDRQSFKSDLLTGRSVPDESKRSALLTYNNPRPAQWPPADYIVGNPPFIGAARMREELGVGYAETLRAAYPDVPESSDFVIYWWHKAADLVRAGKASRFGFITTNSLRQTFARRVVQAQLTATPPLCLSFAIPDHPWVDTADGAAVRIAMTVGVAGEQNGELLEATGEEPQEDGSAKVALYRQLGHISANLTIGANVASTVPLRASEGLSCPGVKLHGSGFIVTPEQAAGLGLDRIPGLERHIRPYRNGKDLTDEPRGVMVIDLFGLSERDIRSRFSTVYQHVLTRVKPERDANNRATYRDNWWVFGEPRKDLRPALAGLPRYIATVETAKHRFFQFLGAEILPDNMVIAVALDDAFHLGVLSSRIHVAYALAAGGTLEDRPRYNKSRCFDPFPFPLCDTTEQERTRTLAEELDAHRKRAQAQHGLTLTGLYNVLEKLRANEPLSDKEKLVHDKGLVSVLKQLHDDLDRAVADAYGWPWPLSDEEILTRLVALNAERAAEEERGVIHWLRPEYQNPGGHRAESAELPLVASEKRAERKPKKGTWPKTLPERVKAVEQALHAGGSPVTPEQLAKQFVRARPADVAEILQTLATVGRARQQGNQFTR